MGWFSGRLMSSASDQKLFCKLSSPFCCSFDEFVEEKVISPSYSSAIFGWHLNKWHNNCWVVIWRKSWILPHTLSQCKRLRRSNQLILKESNPEYLLEGLMWKLKLQYFGHLMWRTDSFEKTLMLGLIEGRRRGWQRMDVWMVASLTQWTWVWANCWR